MVKTEKTYFQKKKQKGEDMKTSATASDKARSYFERNLQKYWDV